MKGRAPARFGIEEEFVLLDDATLVPISVGLGTGVSVRGERAKGSVTPEYLTCQVECVTEPAFTREEAAQQLRLMRQQVSARAREHGAVAAPTATPFVSTGGFVVSPSPHYDEVSAHLAEITREHEVNGLHVHVEVDDGEARVRALNRVRPWMPVLLGLTTNGPFAHGRPSGFESWRSILIRRLPSSWAPPHFHDLSEYHARVQQMLSLGAIRDTASIAWAIRISERYPTVETRVFDAQLAVEDSLFAAVLCRALIRTPPTWISPPLAADVIDDALWVAARRGVDATVIDPSTGEASALWDVARTLIDHVRPALAAHDDEEFVVSHLERIRVDGTGARRQLRAYESGGVTALRELYLRGVDV
ncbi:YbdK family carboxylate-amine ligase [Microbacterium sp. ZW T5_45]|uniref:carboxylate-amine ligase n=1 Tax=Microbacterium sp. ZW T5_45 TaxID=3378080 RepID=UPI0038523BEF